MAGRWDSLKSKFKAKERDLDAEFEKFLNESMSDDSVSSPRHKAPPLKSLRSKGSLEGVSSLPWWAEEEEEEEKRMATRQSWLKPKQEETTVEKDEDVEVKPGTPADSTAISMSKDSLDDGSRPRQEAHDDDDERVPLSPSPEQFEDTLTFTDETAPTSTPATSTPAVPTSHAPGIDTLQELEDKKRFFEQEKTNVDYGKKIQEISTSEFTSAEERTRADQLMATGVEIGDSIFNVTGAAEGAHKEEKADSDIDDKYDDHDDDVEDEYSDHFEEAHDDEDDEVVVGKPPSSQPGSGPVKPSLLSKVSLMDSLDSTLDTKKPLVKRPPLKQEGKASLGGGDTGGEPGAGTTGYLYSGNTETIAELQAALQQAQMEGTQTSERNTGKIVLPPTPTIIQGISNEPAETGQMVIEKALDGGINSRGFDLQPVVISDNTPLEKTLKPPPYKPNFESIGMTLTEGSIDSASIPVDCTGFDLVSVKDTQGGGQEELGATREGREGDLVYPDDVEEEDHDGIEGEEEEEDEDEDTPPPDSLRSIKAKAKERKSVESTRRSSDKRGLATKSSRAHEVKPREAKKGSQGGSKEGHKSRSTKGTGRSPVGAWQPSLSSPPSWSPTPSIRRSRKKDKRPTGSRQKDPVSSPQQLAASVESFANYLKHMVRPEDQENTPPSPRWSDDEPRKSRTSLRNISDGDHLYRRSRERALQEEVENWQLAWKDERRRNDKLISDVAAREKEWNRAEERMREAYEQQIRDLKQEVFALTARLREEEENADNRKRAVAGRKLKGVSEDEKKRLEREIREQEELMRGYQQENERLYRDLKQQQAATKATEARMFSENQRLATEVANLKEHLEQRAPAVSRIPVPVGSAILGADRITQLQTQLGSVKQRETKVQSELDELRLVNTRLESRLRAAERERDTAVQRADQALGATTQEREEIKLRHETEVERLNRKLKWYAENQQLLDHDVAALKAKDQELSELKETVARLRAHQGTAANERRQRNAERTGDAKRIQDLQRQVREMEEIIKRRYPNSLPALIFAAASAPGVAQPPVTESPEKHSPSHAFLENRVKKLENELENKDEESDRRIRAIEQKYNAVKFDYEERIKILEQELKRAGDKVKLSVHPRKAQLEALEQELAAAQEGDRRRIAELESEVNVLQDALAQASSIQAHTAAKDKTTKPEIEKRAAARDNEVDVVKLLVLQRQVQEKEDEISELRRAFNQLKVEKDQLIVSQTQPTQVSQLELEITRLKQRIAELSLNMDQERVRYQASLAESERMVRQAQDDTADRLEKEKRRHQQEINQLRAEFAVRHSSSKVTELQSKIASQEIVILKLKDKIAMSAGDGDALTTAKAREETLKQQIARLHDELRQAKENFTPEMRHFDALQSKISAMELRFNQREEDLNRIINTAQIKYGIEKEESDSRWRRIVDRKNQEIEQFREELDMILEALRELKRQGVILPNFSGQSQSLTS